MLVAGVGACSTGEPDAEVTAPTFAAPSSAAPSPEPEPSPSDEPSEEPTQAAPPLPDAATEQTPEGAVAFTEWWFETLNYATATGDTEALRAASDPGCEFCDNLAGRAEDAYGAGGRIGGGQAHVEITPPGSLQELGVRLAVFARLEESTIYNDAGAVVEEFSGSDSRAVVATVLFVQDGWVMGSVTG